MKPSDAANLMFLAIFLFIASPILILFFIFVYLVLSL
jgi:hypothetical protein